MNASKLHPCGLTAEQITTVKFLVQHIIRADRDVARTQAAMDKLIAADWRRPRHEGKALAAQATDSEFFKGISAGMTSMVHRLVNEWRETNEATQQLEVA